MTLTELRTASPLQEFFSFELGAVRQEVLEKIPKGEILSFSKAQLDGIDRGLRRWRAILEKLMGIQVGPNYRIKFDPNYRIKFEMSNENFGTGLPMDGKCYDANSTPRIFIRLNAQGPNSDSSQRQTQDHALEMDVARLVCHELLHATLQDHFELYRNGIPPEDVFEDVVIRALDSLLFEENETLTADQAREFCLRDTAPIWNTLHRLRDNWARDWNQITFDDLNTKMKLSGSAWRPFSALNEPIAQEASGALPARRFEGLIQMDVERCLGTTLLKQEIETCNPDLFREKLYDLINRFSSACSAGQAPFAYGANHGEISLTNLEGLVRMSATLHTLRGVGGRQPINRAGAQQENIRVRTRQNSQLESGTVRKLMVHRHKHWDVHSRRQLVHEAFHGLPSSGLRLEDVHKLHPLSAWAHILAYAKGATFADHLGSVANDPVDSVPRVFFVGAQESPHISVWIRSKVFLDGQFSDITKYFPQFGSASHPTTSASGPTPAPAVLPLPPDLPDDALRPLYGTVPITLVFLEPSQTQQIERVRALATEYPIELVLFRKEPQVTSPGSSGRRPTDSVLDPVEKPPLKEHRYRESHWEAVDPPENTPNALIYHVDTHTKHRLPTSPLAILMALTRLGFSEFYV